MEWYKSMDCWALILSILAIVGSVFTYFLHDRKIKRQEAKINEYQLAKLKEEEQENKKAQICGTIVKHEKGKRVLKIYNKGKAPATNIRVDGIDEKRCCVNGLELLPFELLNPQEFIEIIIFSFYGNNHTLHVTYYWDDASQKDNEFKQVLSLL
ncbi:MAG: hypothetical protein IKO46_09350 [Salinivirgaceae bacterium]|nr:hypothetical protein [Salinivirgaceae bacterium]